MRHRRRVQARATLLGSTRKAFSLVELLVAVTIIGLLISILLPAVQSAREAARRTACSSKQRQLALGAANYHEARRRYPVGSHNTHWMTWFVQMSPFLEEPQVWADYDKRLYLDESRFNNGENVSVTQRLFPLLSCPSDGESPAQTTMENNPSAHNYVACTGNGVYVATTRGWLSQPPPGRPGISTPQPGYGNGMFRWQGGAFVMSGADENLVPPENPRQVRPATVVRERNIRDGLSKTLAFSEVIRRPRQGGGLTADYRGLTWWGPGTLFSTINPPNASYPDTLPGEFDCGPEALDVAPPCVGPHALSTPIQLAARSRHPGGVLAARLDGSVQFYDDEIDPAAWEALGTSEGGETQ